LPGQHGSSCQTSGPTCPRADEVVPVVSDAEPGTPTGEVGGEKEIPGPVV
jgi:hypothetical protein